MQETCSEQSRIIERGKERAVRNVMIIVIFCGFLVMPAAGQGEGANVATQKGKEGSAAAVALLSQAGELVRYARENESAVAMLAAVQIIQRVQVGAGSERFGPKQTEAQDKVKAEPERPKEQAAAPTLDVMKLLAEARAWAQGDAQTLALIDRAARVKPGTGVATLSKVGGPFRREDQVSPRTTDVYVLIFRGDELARVSVQGNGMSDLDLYVYDENGSEIVKDTSRMDKCLAEWTPRRTGAFRIKVVNLGTIPNKYILITN
jgi:hypothetical protein